MFIDEKQNHGHYEGYCKKVLWPLFHYILWDSATDGSQESNWREDYISVCQSFADAIVAVYKPGDTSKFFFKISKSYIHSFIFSLDTRLSFNNGA